MSSVIRQIAKKLDDGSYEYIDLGVHASNIQGLDEYQSDWDSFSYQPGYVHNRTHYRESGPVTVLGNTGELSWTEVSSSSGESPMSLRAAAQKYYQTDFFKLVIADVINETSEIILVSEEGEIRLKHYMGAYWANFDDGYALRFIIWGSPEGVEYDGNIDRNNI